jgi:hypothetical protein
MDTHKDHFTERERETLEVASNQLICICWLEDYFPSLEVLLNAL